MLHSHSPSPSRFPFNNHSNDSKTESIIKNFYIKTAQTVIQSRQQSPQKNDSTIDQDDGKRRINRWFNMNTREYPDSLRSELKYWITRAFVSPITQPPPLIIEIYLDITNIPAGKELALKHGWKLIDINLGASSNKKKNRILLENWILSLNHPLPTQPLDLGNVYKRSILFFRTLYAFTRLLPSYQTYQHIMLNNNNNTTTTTAAASTIAADDQSCLSIGYRFTSSLNNSKDDEIGLDEGPDANTITRNLDSIVTPLGILGLQVQYRANCDFIIHDPLAMNIDPPLSTPATTTTDASAQLMDLDQYYFTPTIAKYNPTNDSTDEEDEKEEHGFKTITKASILKQKATMTDWPPIPRKSESARVTTATTSSASPFHQRQEYNRRRPSSSSAYRRNMNNNTNTITSVRPANLSLRPLSMNDGDTLFIKSSSTAEPPPPPPAPPLSPSSSSRLHVSPFKSPTLSSSSQHSSTFSLRSLRGVDDEKNSIKSNITRRFSSSFDYRHTERYYHSAPSGGGAEHSNEMQEGSSTTTTSKTRSRRSFSVARKPASSIVSSVDQDDELEEFVRSLNLRQTPEFQSRLLSEDMSESNMHYMDGPSRDVSASYYRSKKALAHFQNLRGMHDSLSQSLISSTILSPPLEEQVTADTNKDQPPSSPRVTTSGGDFGMNSNSSLLSSSLSRGSPLSRLYQPRAPSPLHTEPPVSPTTGTTPVRIPSNPTSPRRLHHHESDTLIARTRTRTTTSDDHRHSNSSSLNEYAKDPYPPFMQTSFQQQQSSSGNNSSPHHHHEPSPSPTIRTFHSNEQPQQRNTLLKYNEIRRNTRLSINTESTSSSSGNTGLDNDDMEGDEEPVSPIVHDEDDDSLVFKMSELGLNEHKQLPHQH